MTDAVVAEGLLKRYGSLTALDGLSLRIPTGQVLALLGPNGAGKTTCVRVLSTLVKPEAGHAVVAGFDVLRQPAQVRGAIGLSGQYAAVDEFLTGRENLDIFGRLYHLGRRAARARAHELLAQFDLEDAANRPVRTYSGGMRRRLDLAAALIARPRVLFLDEPTTGLDPRSRMDMWAMLTDLTAQGTTVLLTTQYLEEADHLADRIIVIDRGRVIADGTADDLKTRVGGEVIEVVVAHQEDVVATTQVLAGISGTSPTVQASVRKVSARIGGDRPAAQVLTEVLRGLDSAGLPLLDVGVRRPSLDDVFLSLTGHSSRGEDEEDV